MFAIKPDMANTNWERVLEDCRQISLPETFLKLQQILARESFSLEEVSDAIAIDPELSDTLLRMVNSPLFDVETPIRKIARAVNFLGAQQVHDLVLGISIAHSFDNLHGPNFDLSEFWQKSAYCAIAARELAGFTSLLDGERLFVIGLMHDIGHLMMQHSLAELTAEADNQAPSSREGISQAQRKTIGFDYAEVGGQMLQNWSLPEGLINCIRYQLTPARADDCPLEAAILNIAVLMTHQLDGTEANAGFMGLADDSVAKLIGINESRIHMVDHRVRAQQPLVMELLFPRFHATNT